MKTLEADRKETLSYAPGLYGSCSGLRLARHERPGLPAAKSALLADRLHFSAKPAFFQTAEREDGYFPPSQDAAHPVAVEADFLRFAPFQGAKPLSHPFGVARRQGHGFTTNPVEKFYARAHGASRLAPRSPACRQGRAGQGQTRGALPRCGLRHRRALRAAPALPQSSGRRPRVQTQAQCSWPHPPGQILTRPPLKRQGRPHA